MAAPEERRPRPALTARIDPYRLPRHIAIRFAVKPPASTPRDGDKQAQPGLTALRKLTGDAIHMDLEIVTLCPDPSPEAIGLFEEFAVQHGGWLHGAGVRVTLLSGQAFQRRELIPTALWFLEEKTRNNRGLRLNLALDYRSRAELVLAAREIARAVAAGRLSLSAIDSQLISRTLETRDQPDPDLMLLLDSRSRVGDAMLWQQAYAELCLASWSLIDYEADMLEEALVDYQSRERRFGRVPSSPPLPRAG